MLSIVFFAIFSVSTFLSSAPSGFCYGDVIIVGPGGYSKISWAIGNASEGDIIFIKSGTYFEGEIVVDKSLKIAGENAETTVIDGSSIADYLFHITASNVIIENITLQNTSNEASRQAPAIRLQNVKNVTMNNVIIQNVYYGIEIRSSNLTRVMDSRLFKSLYSAIYIHDKSCNNTFVGNTIENSTLAVYIADEASQYNMFYYNNFINYTNSVNTFAGENYFDNNYPSGGNYWSAHDAPDLKNGPYPQSMNGSDGIFDEGYPPETTTPRDKYPLTNPIKILKVIVDGEVFKVYVSTNSTINSYNFSVEAKTLTIFTNGTQGTRGSCRVTIPKRLLSCEQLSEWNISISNSEQISYIPLEDEDNTYLYFTYDHAILCEIEIKGTEVVPEFFSAIILISLLIIVTLTTQILKIRLKKVEV